MPMLVVASTVFLQGETRMRAGVEPFLVVLAALAVERGLDALFRTLPSG
jgi:hypothetical protein